MPHKIGSTTLTHYRKEAPLIPTDQILRQLALIIRTGAFTLRQIKAELEFLAKTHSNLLEGTHILLSLLWSSALKTSRVYQANFYVLIQRPLKTYHDRVFTTCLSITKNHWKLFERFIIKYITSGKKLLTSCSLSRLELDTMIKSWQAYMTHVQQVFASPVSLTQKAYTQIKEHLLSYASPPKEAISDNWETIDLLDCDEHG